jgi:uncharacterized secreted protein with C-terminal beta-propeller domain
LAAAGPAPSAAGSKTATKQAAKNAKAAPAVIDRADAQRYLSLGSVQDNWPPPDIMAVIGKYIFFSPENQFYVPPSASGAAAMENEEEVTGRTAIFDAAPPESMAQIGSLGRDGRVLLAGGTALIFSNNSIFAYDILNMQSPRELWQARVSEDSEVLTSRATETNLYLAIRTRIDSANPCPIKPLAAGDKPVIIDCASIYHPDTAILADSIYSVIQIDLASGQAGKSVSFVGSTDNSAVVIGDKTIYAVWGQGGDYISFFCGFLQDKCKNILPNYLLEKAAALPGYNIALSSKELELRALLSNWLSSLSAPEQARLTEEIYKRMADYLRDHYRDFEQTGLAAIDIDSLKFTAQGTVSGRISDSSMINEYRGNLRIITVSGQGASHKMAWLVSGQVSPEQPQKSLSNVYILDDKLSAAGSAESLDLPASLCAARFFQTRACAATCASDSQYYIIDLGGPAEIGVASTIGATPPASFILPLSGQFLVSVSKNNRKIKMITYDVSLAAKPAQTGEYLLNDYWADMEGNYQAFSADGAGSLFFLPAARGGYIFSLKDGQVKLEKNVGSFAVDRSVFLQGNLYVAGVAGIEVYGGAGWEKIKTIKF